MSLVKLNVTGVFPSPIHNSAYVLILSEEKGVRKFLVTIGSFEAQSIVVALEKDMTPNRPLTHDFIESIINGFDILLKQVMIHKLMNGIFYTSAIFERDGIEEIIDARNSDAIALALRVGAPIYTYENLLEKAGVNIDILIYNKDREGSDNVLEKKTDEDIENNLLFRLEDVDNLLEISNENLMDLSIEELNKLLEEEVKKENYEIASQIRDIINKKNSK